MKTALIQQYSHTWRVFERLAGDFDARAWLHTGRGAMTPARLSFHILWSVRYYMQSAAPDHFASGKTFNADWAAVDEAALPSQADVAACIGEMNAQTSQWLSAMDLAGENQAFPWAGPIQGGVALFSLRHTLYHLGELSALLNESKQGIVEDHYVKAI